jgi:hypothetical protein
MKTALLAAAVEDDADVGLGFDVLGRGDEHLLDGEVVDLHPEDVGGVLRASCGGLGQLHAARLAAAAGVDLRLDDDHAAVLRGDPLRLLRRGRDLARRDRDSVGAEDLLRLVLVDVHEPLC